MNANTPAEFIARLLAQRWLPKSDAEVRRLLIDESFRQDIEHRLTAAGLRLLDNPFAGHIALVKQRHRSARVPIIERRGEATPSAWRDAYAYFERLNRSVPFTTAELDAFAAFVETA